MRPEPPAGAVAILAAFVLLTLMAGVAFATSRNLLREWPMAGDAVRGAEAAAAAESGLAWFLAWSSGADGLGALDSGQEQVLAPPPGLLPEPPGSRFRQSFQLRIRPLGALAGPGDEAGPAEQLWLVTATGRSALEGRERSGYVQVRELLVATPAAARDQPGQEAPPGLRILAWRVQTPSP